MQQLLKWRDPDSNREHHDFQSGLGHSRISTVVQLYCLFKPNSRLFRSPVLPTGSGCVGVVVGVLRCTLRGTCRSTVIARRRVRTHLHVLSPPGHPTADTLWLRPYRWSSGHTNRAGENNQPSCADMNRSRPNCRDRNLATSCPFTLFPAPSSGGAKVPSPPLPGETVTIPPPMPLLPGSPIS
jgi:hypothetical protein